MPHIVTPEEIADVETLGYEITNSAETCLKFLNGYFPGIHIGDYVKGLESLLSALTGAPITRELSWHESPPPMLFIQYHSEDSENELTGLAFSQALTRYDNEIIAELDYLRIPAAARRNGVSKRVLKLSVQQYEQIGVAKIKLEAALSNGGLVWAKAFFTASEPEEVKAILIKAEKELPPEQFKFVKRVYDNYYDQNPGGKSFPMVKWSQLSGMDQILTGSIWRGELDLNNSDILTKFKNYVA